MKTKTLFYMALTAVMTTLAACSQDDELMDAAPKQAQIEFEITDGGYGGDEATRAVEEGLRTKFEAGDECGLYIIDNGEFIASNVMLTAEAGENGEITWKAADGAINGVTENSKYFLYYPYNENLESMNMNNAQLGDDDTKVFKNLIDKFGFDLYQYTQDLYTQSDLMTATGTASTGADGKLKVSFSLTHQMALAVIELPKTVYKFTDTSIPDYTVALSVDFSDSDCKPLRMEDGTYRFVFNSDLTGIKSITGTVNGNKKFTISADKLKGIKKGTYKTFRIGGGDATKQKNHNLQVGDYLMKDGNLIGKDELTDGQKADVAAIVFWAGHNEYDLSDYSATGIGTVKCHGYAVAKEDAYNSYCRWGKTGVAVGCYPRSEGGSPMNNYSTDGSKKDWSGYSYTQKIKTKAGTLSSASSNYPATYYAVVKYPETTAAPVTSSGWFLPAVGQMVDVFEKKTSLFTDGFGALSSSKYWSSSEYYSSPADKAISIETYGPLNSGKDSYSNICVRAILAF